MERGTGTRNGDGDRDGGKILNGDGRRGACPRPHGYLLSSLCIRTDDSIMLKLGCGNMGKGHFELLNFDILNHMCFILFCYISFSIVKRLLAFLPTKNKNKKGTISVLSHLTLVLLMRVCMV